MCVAHTWTQTLHTACSSQTWPQYGSVAAVRYCDITVTSSRKIQRIMRGLITVSIQRSYERAMFPHIHTKIYAHIYAHTHTLTHTHTHKHTHAHAHTLTMLPMATILMSSSPLAHPPANRYRHMSRCLPGAAG